ncbi:uncharacterized protein AMSG_08074 [Thecamonas trahens ATCC 50062]|uniref:DOMON domain-containing protein n=1 Tax=Thecamonas trahens ATCC 50062 TaxID=461836 RepID=A0A0L0DJV3_THETB|nr:hypothetical protein AMSG_08074 [Thecamonas trahens ATCC 50062]KNC52510.1 hypothetical protein AMSG_08074 [Thecamonas trahens ATCC 50062]|eukprot:XP_013755304.1 hypothetical protein AMSG_08074 [Thecamonas trahens ATCC 50062]
MVGAEKPATGIVPSPAFFYFAENGPGVPLTLQSSAADTIYRGFLLFASDPASSPTSPRYGALDITSGAMKSKTCDGSAVATLTHTARSAKLTLATTWHPPAVASENAPVADHVAIHAVVVTETPYWYRAVSGVMHHVDAYNVRLAHADGSSAGASHLSPPFSRATLDYSALVTSNLLNISSDFMGPGRPELFSEDLGLAGVVIPPAGLNVLLPGSGLYELVVDVRGDDGTLAKEYIIHVEARIHNASCAATRPIVNDILLSGLAASALSPPFDPAADAASGTRYAAAAAASESEVVFGVDWRYVGDGFVWSASLPLVTGTNSFAVNVTGDAAWSSYATDYSVSWALDSVAGTLAVQLRAETQGWIGFGFSPSGSMANADVWIAWIDDSPGSSCAAGCVFDYNVNGHTRPSLDAQQDVVLSRAVREGGYLVVDLVRALNTGDSDDWEIDVNAAAPIATIHAVRIEASGLPSSDGTGFSIHTAGNAATTIDYARRPTDPPPPPPAPSSSSPAPVVSDSTRPKATTVHIVHGLLAVVVWLVMQPLSFIFVRYIRFYRKQQAKDQERAEMWRRRNERLAGETLPSPSNPPSVSDEPELDESGHVVTRMVLPSDVLPNRRPGLLFAAEALGVLVTFVVVVMGLASVDGSNGAHALHMWGGVALFASAVVQLALAFMTRSVEAATCYRPTHDTLQGVNWLLALVVSLNGLVIAVSPWYLHILVWFFAFGAIVVVAVLAYKKHAWRKAAAAAAANASETIAAARAGDSPSTASFDASASADSEHRPAGASAAPAKPSKPAFGDDARSASGGYSSYYDDDQGDTKPVPKPVAPGPESVSADEPVALGDVALQPIAPPTDDAAPSQSRRDARRRVPASTSTPTPKPVRRAPAPPQTAPVPAPAAPAPEFNADFGAAFEADFNEFTEPKPKLKPNPASEPGASFSSFSE